MKTDRELLELAAKAAGIDWFDEPALLAGKGLHMKSGSFWNPLTDDGDALRLAVELKLRIETDVMLCGFECLNPSGTVLVDYGDGEEIEEPHNGDGLAATRRAIVRAAAVIGEIRI